MRQRPPPPAQVKTEYRYTGQVHGLWSASNVWMGMGFVLQDANEVILQGQKCVPQAQSPIQLDDTSFVLDCQQVRNLVGRVAGFSHRVG